MQLDEVDAVDTHALERTADLGSRPLVIAPPGLRRKEETVAMLHEPGLQAVLRLPVGRGDVDVVDTVLEQELENRVRLGLRHAPTDRGGAEDRAGALVA